jgi:hypothetical protein
VKNSLHLRDLECLLTKPASYSFLKKKKKNNIFFSAFFFPNSSTFFFGNDHGGPSSVPFPLLSGGDEQSCPFAIFSLARKKTISFRVLYT